MGTADRLQLTALLLKLVLNGGWQEQKDICGPQVASDTLWQSPKLNPSPLLHIPLTPL